MSKSVLHLGGLGDRESLTTWEINPMKFQGLGITIHFLGVHRLWAQRIILSEVKDT